MWALYEAPLEALQPVRARVEHDLKAGPCRQWRYGSKSERLSMQIDGRDCTVPFPAAEDVKPSRRKRHQIRWGLHAAEEVEKGHSFGTVECSHPPDADIPLRCLLSTKFMKAFAVFVSQLAFRSSALRNSIAEGKRRSSRYTRLSAMVVIV